MLNNTFHSEKVETGQKNKKVTEREGVRVSVRVRQRERQRDMERVCP
jgi:hypothetical protein